MTLTLTNPAGAALACAANPRKATSGVASFTGCKIDKTGTYTLTATDGSMASATSSRVTITAGAPAIVSVVSGSAESATVGEAFISPLVVRVTDTSANPVPVATVTFTARTPTATPCPLPPAAPR